MAERLEGLHAFTALKTLKGEKLRLGLAMLGEEHLVSLYHSWERWAHTGQLPPADPDWQTWVIKAGRGYGKTLAGAQWIAGLVAAHENVPLRIALVGATLDDARRVMIEGRSGLLEVAGRLVDDWQPSFGRLRFTGGSEATLFSGATPHFLRGPEHHYAWCDELAKWDKPQESWDMLQMGLRLGKHPRALITTTPRPGPVLTGIMDDPTTHVTGGSTMANPHLPRAFKDRMGQLYGGTRLGRQEIDGEVLPDVAGALWTVELLGRCRLGSFETGLRDAGCAGSSAPPQDERVLANLAHPEERGRMAECLEAAHPEERGRMAECLEGPSFTKTLIAVDPPTGDGTCGIIACAREDRPDGIHHAHILADHSVTARSTEGWANAVADAAKAHGTQQIVAEGNQGGEMIQAVLRNADPGLSVRLVHAKVGKSLRAEPVAHLFEAGRVWLHRRFPELEAQLMGMIAGGGYEGPGRSPDRADAMVWGVTELLVQPRAEVRVTRL